MKVRVKGDLVFIRPQPKPAASAGGIALVHDNPHHIDRGVIVAIGDGPITAKGVVLPHLVKVGDRVIFSPDDGQELLFEKETVIALRETDVLAVVES